MDVNQKLPLFPLPNLIFPQGILPLRIFEPRYLQMIVNRAQCDEAFGVIFEKDKNEGADAHLGSIGTTVKIVDFDQLNDGFLGITCIGLNRFTVEGCHQTEQGIWMGDIKTLPDHPNKNCPLPPGRHVLRQILERFYPKLGAPFTDYPTYYNKADWVSNRLCELLPLKPEKKEMLLSINNPIVRFEKLLPICDELESAYL